MQAGKGEGKVFGTGGAGLELEEEEVEGSIENSPKLAPLVERKVSLCRRKRFLKKQARKDATETIPMTH